MGTCAFSISLAVFTRPYYKLHGWPARSAPFLDLVTTWLSLDRTLSLSLLFRSPHGTSNQQCNLRPRRACSGILPPCRVSSAVQDGPASSGRRRVIDWLSDRTSRWSSDGSCSRGRPGQQEQRRSSLRTGQGRRRRQQIALQHVISMAPPSTRRRGAGSKAGGYVPSRSNPRSGGAPLHNLPHSNAAQT